MFAIWSNRQAVFWWFWWFVENMANIGETWAKDNIDTFFRDGSVATQWEEQAYSYQFGCKLVGDIRFHGNKDSDEHSIVGKSQCYRVQRRWAHHGSGRSLKICCFVLNLQQQYSHPKVRIGRPQRGHKFFVFFRRKPLGGGAEKRSGGHLEPPQGISD